MFGLGRLFKKKATVILPWSQQKNYKGGHRKGVPVKGSQHRKHTLRGGLFR